MAFRLSTCKIAPTQRMADVIVAGSAKGVSAIVYNFLSPRFLDFFNLKSKLDRVLWPCQKNWL